MRRTAAIAGAALVLALTVLVVTHSVGTSSQRRGAVSRKAAAGVPARLLALRAADPGGGAPWGLRLARTADGLLCAQVGRVSGGALGQLGVDDAFKDDERFHPLAQGQFSEVTVPGTVGDDAECVATKETFSGTIDGLDRNAVANPQGKSGPLTDRREIAFGLLGPHALAVTYKDGTRTVTQPVMRGLGAFLIVRPARHRGFLGNIGAAPGSDYSDALAPAGPTGFIEAITYRYRTTVCRDNGTNTIARCHLSDGPPGPERTPSQNGD
jgi:hypothetical protein